MDTRQIETFVLAVDDLRQQYKSHIGHIELMLHAPGGNNIGKAVFYETGRVAFMPRGTKELRSESAT